MNCRAGDFARRRALAVSQGFGERHLHNSTVFPPQTLPGGRERPPYNAGQTGGGTGDKNLSPPRTGR